MKSLYSRKQHVLKCMDSGKLQDYLLWNRVYNI